MMIGDQVLSVNGYDLRQASNELVWNVLRGENQNQARDMTIVVRRPPHAEKVTKLPSFILILYHLFVSVLRDLLSPSSRK